MLPLPIFRQLKKTYEEPVTQNVRCGIRRGPENVIPRVFACGEEAQRAARVIAPINPHILSPEPVGSDSDGDEHKENAAIYDVEDTPFTVARRATQDAVDCCEECAELNT